MRLTDEQLDSLEHSHGMIESEYTPTCRSAGYGNGCPGANDSSIEFWRRAVDALPAMLAEIRAHRAAALTDEDREALRSLADANRCAMFGAGCTDALCAETQAGVTVLDRLLAGARDA